MRYVVPGLLGTVLWCAVAAAQTPAKLSGKAAADAISPFVGEQTIGIAHIDLSRVDFDQWLNRAGELAPGSEKLLAAAAERMRPMKRLADAGIKDVFLVISLADLPQNPLVVFPKADHVDALSLEAWQRELRVEQIERVGNALLAGGKQAIERAKHQPPEARPEIARAFEAAGDAAVQIVLSPTADDRRVIEELLPILPGEIGGGPSKTLTRGVMWAALSVDLSQPAAKLMIQSQDAEAAAALRDKWLAVLRSLGRDGRVAKTVRQFDQFAERLEPTVKQDRLQLSLDPQGAAWEPLARLLRTGLDAAQETQRREETVAHLKRIGLALHTYLDVHKTFPAAASYGADGKPLLSWRVHILPYLEQQRLYNEFHLDEPWDSEHNRKLIDRMPEVYQSGNWSRAQPAKTCFVGVTSDAGKSAPEPGSGAAAAGAGKPFEDRLGTMFQGREGTKIQLVTDGTSNTILVVESDAEHSVVWTKPDDLLYNAEQPATGFGFDADGRIATLFCDGSVRKLKQSLDVEMWRRLLLRNDGKQVRAD